MPDGTEFRTNVAELELPATFYGQARRWSPVQRLWAEVVFQACAEYLGQFPVSLPTTQRLKLQAQARAWLQGRLPGAPDPDPICAILGLDRKAVVSLLNSHLARSSTAGRPNHPHSGASPTPERGANERPSPEERAIVRRVLELRRAGLRDRIIADTVAREFRIPMPLPLLRSLARQTT